MDWKFLATISGLWLAALIAMAIYAKLDGMDESVLVYCAIVGTILFGISSIVALIGCSKEVK